MFNVKFWIKNSKSNIKNSKSTSGLQSPSFRSDGEVRRTLGLPSGDQSALEPPGPIPNPEVKRRSADGSGTIGPVRVGRRQVFARLQLTLGPGSFFARMAREKLILPSLQREIEIPKNTKVDENQS